MTRQSTYLFLVAVLLTGCASWLGPAWPDNDYYNIEDGAVRLFFKYEQDSFIPYTSHDSFVRENYPVKNNLPGHYCRRLEMTKKLDTSKALGVVLRFKDDGRANANYGEYKKGGLIEKVKKISVSLENGNMKYDITKELKGHETDTAYYWIGEQDSAKREMFWSASLHSNGCHATVYHPDIDALTKTANFYEPYSIGLAGWDWLFWLDKNVVSGLTFKPTKLKMQVTFIDSTGTKFRQLTDSSLID